MQPQPLFEEDGDDEDEADLRLFSEEEVDVLLDFSEADILLWEDVDESLISLHIFFLLRILNSNGVKPRLRR